MRQKKRAIKEKREAAAAAELDMSPAGVALTNEIVNSRRHLCEFRVVQRNLVYVIGISAKIAHEHILKEPEFFGQFGKIIKLSLIRRISLQLRRDRILPVPRLTLHLYGRMTQPGPLNTLMDQFTMDE